jgi:uncharacterized pyridoxamine 5'-phosphate oxidase family protein
MGRSSMLSHQQIAYEFIVQNRAGALATCTPDGEPHVVTIYSVIEPSLTIYFATRVESRKYRNIVANPRVALCFTDEAAMRTIQLTGKATRVESLEMEQHVLYELIKLRYGEPDWPVPPIKMFERGTTMELAIVKVVPAQVTLASFKTLPGGRYEPFYIKVL